MPSAPMRVFLVLIEPGQDGAVRKLKKSFPKAYPLVPPQVHLVRSDKLASQIADDLGMDATPLETRTTGAVFRMNHHVFNGWYNSELWDWLEDES